LLVVKYRAPEVGIPEQRHTGEPGDDFPQQLRRFPLSSEEILLRPVTFPPGCARFATNPFPIGSILFVITTSPKRRPDNEECG